MIPKDKKIKFKRPLKKDKKRSLMTNCSLMKVGSIAKCSLGALAFHNTFDLHLAIIGLGHFDSGCFTQVMINLTILILKLSISHF